MHRPFAILEEWVREGRIRVSDNPSRAAGIDLDAKSLEVEDPSEVASESELFEAAMTDVRPLQLNLGHTRASDPVVIRSGDDEEEALEALREFCETGRIEPEHTREYVEHVVHPMGRLYLNDLRLGRFAIQAHLDLHGFTVEQARQIVEAFLEASVRAGYRCVRVVHGRGRHSRGRQPLMKLKVEQWLRYRRLARYVVAYTSARRVDGGGGALYVLLGGNR